MTPATKPEQIFLVGGVVDNGDFAAQDLEVGWQSEEIEAGEKHSYTHSSALALDPPYELLPFGRTRVELPFETIACNYQEFGADEGRVRIWVSSGSGTVYGDYVPVPARWQEYDC